MSMDVPITAVEHTLLHRLYYQLYLIQEVDRRIARHATTKLHTVHALHDPCGNLGICNLAVLNAIDPAKDTIFTTCGDHLHLLLQQNDVEAYYRRMTLLHNNPHSPAIECEQARQLVCEALNNALTARLAATDNISIVILDAHTVKQAHLTHYFDVASLWSLPLLFVLDVHENDSAHPPLMASEKDATYSLKSQAIRANDLLKVYAFASAAVSYVRRARRPFLLHLLSQPPAINVHGALANIGHKLSISEQQEIKGAVIMRIEQALTHINTAPSPGFRI